MENPELQALVTTDWFMPCIASRFCFPCRSQLCLHCCEDHHGTHHPEEILPVVEVQSAGGGDGVPAVNANRFRGCGYDLSRISWEGRSWILLCSPGHDDKRYTRDRCERCNHSIKSGSRWCSTGCKAEAAAGGSRREAARRLGVLAEAREFGEPVHIKNRFCVLCGLAYCNTFCPYHVENHHPDHPEADPGSVKIVTRIHGWAAVPEGQLPPDFVEGVQRLYKADGSVLYPIQYTAWKLKSRIRAPRRSTCSASAGTPVCDPGVRSSSPGTSTIAASGAATCPPRSSLDTA